MLDQGTMFFLLALMAALLAGVCVAVRAAFGDEARGLGLWSAGLLCIAVASLLVWVAASRGWTNGQNLFWVASMGLLGASLSRFADARAPLFGWGLSALGVFAATVVFASVVPNHELRIGLISLYAAACGGIGFRALFRSDAGGWSVGSAFVLAGVVLLVVGCSQRLVAGWLAGSGALRFFGTEAQVAVPFFILCCLGMATLVALGLILLAGGRLRRRLERLAAQDALTGLLNRRGFTERVAPLLALARRRGEPVALAVVDLDDFKQVNDALGHEAGDQLLVELGALLVGSAREHDVVVRFGGEEFGVLMPNTGLDGALRVAERLRARVAEIVVAEGGHRVTASVGVAVAVAPASVDGLYAEADRALYAAKGAGKNRVLAPAV